MTELSTLVRGSRPIRRIPYFPAKPEDPTRIAIRRLSPNSIADFRHLLSLVKETTGGEETPETMEEAIRRGDHLVFGGYYDNTLKCIIVVSILQCSTKRVLFINHLQGQVFHYGFYPPGWELLKTLAASRGCAAVRVRGKGHRWLDTFNIDSQEADWIFDICL